MEDGGSTVCGNCCRGQSVASNPRGVRRKGRQAGNTHATSVLFTTQLLLAVYLLAAVVDAQTDHVCYNATTGAAKRCVPVDSYRPALMREVWTTNSSCQTSELFCELRNGSVACENCNTQFNVANLNDISGIAVTTSWQSSVLPTPSDNVVLSFFGYQYIHLVRSLLLTFPRPPSSFYIEKSVDAGSTWTKMAYFALDCSAAYGMTPNADVSDSPRTPRCEPLFPDETSLTFQSVAGRETGSQDTHENLIQSSPEYRQFASANALRIVFDEVNRPAAAEVSSSGRSLDLFTYYRASDAVIASQLHCNGHAGGDFAGKCVCVHNTQGDECSECIPFYHDLLWQPATDSSPFECRECSCNNRSMTCAFNQTVYDFTSRQLGVAASGGHCRNCTGNTEGVSCELCVDGHYPDPGVAISHPSYCIPCACNLDGVRNANPICLKTTRTPIPGLENGQCFCKELTTGRVCDECDPNAYDFNSDPVTGCTDCRCNTSGTVARSDSCHNTTGQCACKANAAGRRCDSCRDGTYGLRDADADGCRPCDCQLGHSSSNVCDKLVGQCPCRPGFTGRRCEAVIAQHFIPDVDAVRFEAETPATTNGVGFVLLTASGAVMNPSLVTVPKTLSYCVTVRYNATADTGVTVQVMQGSSDDFYSGNARPTGTALSVQTVRLTEGVPYNFLITSDREILIDSLVLVPQVSELPQFRQSDLAAFTAAGCGPLPCALSTSDVLAMSAECRRILSRAMAELTGGASVCGCSGPGSVNASCQPIGGQCICRLGNTGRQCDECSPEYYINSSAPTGCQACECDDVGSTSPICQLATGQCPCHPGRDGARTCDVCQADFYFPAGGAGPCEMCTCNATGRSSSQCSDGTGGCRCLPGVAGLHCTECRRFFWGFSDTGCQFCNCDQAGSTGLCDMFSGQCHCHNLTEGMQCDRCKPGSHYLNSTLLSGCKLCECNGHANSCTTAVPDGHLVGAGHPNCSCPVGYDGLQCQRCAAGYTHAKPAPGRSAVSTDACVPCACSGHSTTCDRDTGVCSSCADSTVGDACERCQVGYYGDATAGTATDCTQCACPLRNTTDNACSTDGSGGYVCSRCPASTSGAHCERCADGFSGDPLRGTLCSDCSCNGNVDPAATGNCNTVTGECLRCVGNTTGTTCELCADHHYGDATLAKNCTLCECGGGGTKPATTCDRSSGQCDCRAGVDGRRCDRCQANRFGFGASDGCTACACTAEGSRSPQCHAVTGACDCLAGVGGAKCDLCLSGFYAAVGMADSCNDTSNSSCRACCCDTSNTIGQSSTCDVTGSCSCRTGSEGKRCDVCSAEHYRDASTGCQRCQCNGHATSCTNSTHCTACQHDTTGDQCQLCRHGYYGDATAGAPTDCRPCACNGFADACVPGGGSGFVCQGCRNNTVGDRCESCAVDHYRDPSAASGCLPCLQKCNGNTQTCDVATGRCSGCGFNTTGDSCEICADDHYGDATQRTCRACQCSALGTDASVTCNRHDGSCHCLPNVGGHNCSSCDLNHFNFSSGGGCSACGCGVGATDGACHGVTGQCSCGNLVIGVRCDRCDATAFNLRTSQCSACGCNVTGTLAGGQSCNQTTGQCRCEPGTVGLHCDSCRPGYYWTSTGCAACACSTQSNSCDPRTGVCSNCTGNTAGDNCQVCADRFYRSAGLCVDCGCHSDGAVDNSCHGTTGQCTCRGGVDSSTRTCSLCLDNFHSLNSSGCQPCLCDGTGTMVGTSCNKTGGQCQCATGYTSTQCRACDTRFYRGGSRCEPCNCESVGTTDGGATCGVSDGQCSCLSNVTERRCDRCAADFFDFGNPAGCSPCECHALGAATPQCNATGGCTCRPGVRGIKCDQCRDEFHDLTATGCRACNCSVNGSVNQVCNTETGQCQCHPNIVDLKCFNCQSGHFVEAGGTGCVRCMCDARGTTNGTCEPDGGQCPCQHARIAGRACDACLPLHYNFPTCTACQCNMSGSFNGSCDDGGRCFCRPNSLGDKCNTCLENYVLTSSGCELCPSCYNITQSQVENIRMRLNASVSNLLIIITDPLLMDFIRRQGNASQLYTDLLLLANATSTDESWRIASAILLLANTTDLNAAYPSLGSPQYPTALPFQALFRLQRELQGVRNDLFFTTTQVGRTQTDLAESYAITVQLAAVTASALSSYQQLVNLRRLSTAMRDQVSGNASALRSQATRINATAASAEMTASEALATQRQAASQSATTDGSLAATSTTVRAATLSVPSAETSSASADAAEKAASSARQNTSAEFPLPATGPHEALTNSYGVDAAALSHGAESTDRLNVDDSLTVAKHRRDITSISASAHDALTLSSDLRNRSQIALASTQSSKTTADRTITIARSDLSILSNFSDESIRAKKHADDALAAASAVVPSANQAKQDADAILAQHGTASTEALDAAQRSTAAAQSVTDDDKTAQQQLSQATQASWTLTSLATSTDQLNSSIAVKTQQSSTLRTACSRSAEQVAGDADDVVITSSTAAAAAAAAQEAVTAAQNLETALASVADIPTAKLALLNGDLSRIQSSLSRAQVSSMITSLQQALAEKEAAQIMLRSSLSAVAAEVQTLDAQRDALVASCQVATPPS